MKIINFLIISTVLVVLLGNVSSTCFAHGGITKLSKPPLLSGSLAKIVGSRGVTSEALQRLSEQYDSLHESLSSQPFESQVEQQFHAFRLALSEVGVLHEAEAMLYVAALAGNRDAGAAALTLRERDFFYN